MKYFLKNLAISAIIFVLLQLFMIIPFCILNNSQNLHLGFPFTFYSQLDAQCYITRNFQREFLLVNFIIVTLCTFLVLFLIKKLKK